MKHRKHFGAAAVAALCAITIGAQSALAVRTTTTAVNPKNINQGAIGANTADQLFTAVDVANGNQVILDPGMACIVQNSHGVTAYYVSFVSAADDLGRTADIQYTLQAGEFAVFGPFTLRGWAQSDGMLYYTGENAAIKTMFIKPKNPHI